MLYWGVEWNNNSLVALISNLNIQIFHNSMLILSCAYLAHLMGSMSFEEGGQCNGIRLLLLHFIVLPVSNIGHARSM